MRRSSAKPHYLGLDVGAVSLSAVLTDPGGIIVRQLRRPHGGDVEGCFREALAGMDLPPSVRVAATTSTPLFLPATRRYDDQICLIAAARQLNPDARSILVVGGERFGLVRFDEAGEYLSFKANPGCAAGTGGFLDQQARRLELESVEVLASLALNNQAAPPKIASRCAVFAKTDLVHAQQEGHALDAICDGLCRGVARNIVDALFTGETVHGPVLVVGGVARNGAVIRHLRELLGLELIVEGELPYGAAGAALKLLAESEEEAVPLAGDSTIRPAGLRSLLAGVGKGGTMERSYEYPPLELRYSTYPSFESLSYYRFRGRLVPHAHELEVDLYRDLEPTKLHSLFLGIDIGSTSTKAVLTDEEGEVVAGFYTATAGNPLMATRLILEAVVEWKERTGRSFELRGVGTTGAGRKFIGRILGADLILDEITAHARAAVELHPGVDTIVEIGGQDSKFTTLKDGRVTLSVMNSVCAAGTGSFVEEQARRLGVPLDEYGDRTRGCASPMASERCTVFMERDLNHYLREGYSTGEVLAAVLHSVRENYLNKVAVEALVGDVVVFQGATARNRALVAAFEQRMGKPILVSKYCHLTGALGVALTLKEEGVAFSTFRGLGLHAVDIPVRSETCDFCPNHCKLSVAEVEGETVAYGFLCGRDWDTHRFVRNNTSGFDLFKARRRAQRPGYAGKERSRIRSLTSTRFTGARSTPARQELTIGLPAALHLFEDVPFWKSFFRHLGVKVITSERFPDALRVGRTLAGAELCAPMTALHGHVRYLLDEADLVFCPFYLERKSGDEGSKRKLCYYTQYAPTLGSNIAPPEDRGRVLTPLIHAPYGSLFSKAELYRILNQTLPGGVSPLEVYGAFDRAEQARADAWAKLRESYRVEAGRGDGFHVVLLGRPYTVLSRWMNKGIPDTFASLGVRVFYQDMLSWEPEEVAAIRPLLDDVHWLYASQILEAAEITARTPGAYPVLLSSFKCSPDSFITTYVRQILEHHGKPYLVLELDEHDSRLGYETRIEAAVRSFRNHHDSVAGVRPFPRFGPFHGPSVSKEDLAHKTLYFPNWDSLSHRLLVAAVRKTGLDARLLAPTEESIRRSLRHNSGQCTPLNIIAQDFMETVRRQEVDPARSVLWMISSNVSCNIRLYPHHIRTILRAHGGGFEDSDVYAGPLSLQDISTTLPYDAYMAYMFGGFLRRMGCRVRPYETGKGETDRVLEEGIGALQEVFETGGSKEDVLAGIVDRFQAIQLAGPRNRPEVAIFGDIYSRDNQVLNQDLIHFIEAHGGEVITTPYTSYLKMVVRPYYWKWFLEGKFRNVLTTKAWMTALPQLEKRYFRYFESILGDPEPAYDASPQAILAEYNVRMEHTGETMENLLKVFYITRHHPEVALFVQASPAFCCPSLITEALSREIEEKTGVPVVSVTYDGAGGGKNDVILPYLEYPRNQRTA